MDETNITSKKSASNPSDQLYKIIFSKGDNLELRGDILNEMLMSGDQLFKILHKDGTFTILNKAHIVQVYFIKLIGQPTSNPNNYVLIDGVYKLKENI